MIHTIQNIVLYGKIAIGIGCFTVSGLVAAVIILGLRLRKVEEKLNALSKWEGGE
jgi:hypothetical protein